MPATKTVPHATKSYSREQQERFVDALLASLLPEADEQGKSVVHVVVDSTGIRVLALPDDPIARADKLGDAWVTGLWLAGADYKKRLRLVQMANQRICEILAIIEDFGPSQELKKRWREGLFPDADSYVRELSSTQ